MWNSIKERIFPLIIALSALSVSASAAVYSVTGLSMLFAGASTAVIIMAASLEVSKLVIASLLYQYWSKLNKIFKSIFNYSSRCINFNYISRYLWLLIFSISENCRSN
jgi:hypothetical protein